MIKCIPTQSIALLSIHLYIVGSVWNRLRARSNQLAWRKPQHTLDSLLLCSECAVILRFVAVRYWTYSWSDGVTEPQSIGSTSVSWKLSGRTQLFPHSIRLEHFDWDHTSIYTVCKSADVFISLNLLQTDIVIGRYYHKLHI